MGTPAARVGDPTSHGAPLAGLGCATVMIANAPAWRVGDVFTCPLSNGPQPHGGGAVAMGSTSVSIGGQFAARMYDQIVEAGGGPNAILAGCPTVQIG
jgi:uncharacterized Zn-binding protein involved in type VI secretion